MAHQDIHAAMQDAYETLLLSYAAGLLDQAQSLIVASHVALSPVAKEKVHACEAVGGALMEKYCEPVKMKPTSLHNVLARLESIEDPDEREEMYELVFPQGLSIPLCLKRSVACSKQQAHWRAVRPGIEAFELHLECRQSHAQFMKAQRGVEKPIQKPRGIELTLILDGALADNTGFYKRGDLMILDETCRQLHKTAKSCPREGGFYMVVSSGGSSNGLQRFLQHLMGL